MRAGEAADLLILTALGLIGLLMRHADVPVAPAIVGLILFPLFEQQLRRDQRTDRADAKVVAVLPGRHGKVHGFVLSDGTVF